MKKSFFILVVGLLPCFSLCPQIAAQEQANRGNLSGYFDMYITAGYDNKEEFDLSWENFDWKEFDWEKDVYLETNLSLLYDKPLTDLTKALVDYTFNSTNYYDQTEISSYENNLSLDLKRQLSETFSGTIGYSFAHLYVPDDSTLDFWGHKIKTSLKQILAEKWFHEATYFIGIKTFNDDQARNTDGSSQNEDRKETRHAVEYEIGTWFQKILVKLKYQFSINTSNDDYLNYYNYSMNKISLLGYAPFPFKKFFWLERWLDFKKIYGIISVSYRNKDFTDRLILSSDSTTQKDDLYTGFASLTYDVTDSWAISLNGSYMWNHSNEPTQDYSGANVSFGVHYSF